MIYYTSRRKKGNGDRSLKIEQQQCTKDSENSFEIFKLDQQIIENNAYDFRNKNIVFIGDSITQGVQATVDSEGNKTIAKPLIRDIIFEAVHHFGGEHPSRIIIQDVDEVGRQVVRYLGSTPIQFLPPKATDDRGRSFILSEIPDPDNAIYYKNDILGYMETPLTYPGELIEGAGSAVTNLLDEVVGALGNFEYFYDSDGNFIFRRISNYEMTGQIPLNYLDSMDNALQDSYFPKFSDSRFINEYADADLIMNIGFNPKYDNIKNDFIYWGTKNANDNTATIVRYHLAIDERPKDSGDALCRQAIFSASYINTPNKIEFYCTEDGKPLTGDYLFNEVAPNLEIVFADYPELQFNWREELQLMDLYMTKNFLQNGVIFMMPVALNLNQNGRHIMGEEFLGTAILLI